jgi:hypothetical protein
MAKSSHTHALSGLTVSPPLKEITLGPGLIETATDVTIQNNTNQSVRAHLQLVDLKSLGIYGGTTLDKAGLTDKYDLANWMSLPGGDTVVIASGQTVKVKVNITNRSDLAPGGHYGAVVITSSAADSGIKSDVNISQQLVSLMFIKKLGGEVYGLQLEPISYKGSSMPDQITTRFKSTGNVHVVPRGFIEVTDPSGKVVSKGILNPDSNIILPGSTRQLVTLMQSVSAANKPGRYKVTVYYRYDGQKDFMSESTYFTHGNILVQIMIGIALVAAVATAVTFGLLRVKRKRPINRSK